MDNETRNKIAYWLAFCHQFTKDCEDAEYTDTDDAIDLINRAESIIRSIPFN